MSSTKSIGIFRRLGESEDGNTKDRDSLLSTSGGSVKSIPVFHTGDLKLIRRFERRYYKLERVSERSTTIGNCVDTDPKIKKCIDRREWSVLCRYLKSKSGRSDVLSQVGVVLRELEQTTPPAPVADSERRSALSSRHPSLPVPTEIPYTRSKLCWGMESCTVTASDKDVHNLKKSSRIQKIVRKKEQREPYLHFKDDETADTVSMCSGGTSTTITGSRPCRSLTYLHDLCTVLNTPSYDGEDALSPISDYMDALRSVLTIHPASVFIRSPADGFNTPLHVLFRYHGYAWKKRDCVMWKWERRRDEEVTTNKLHPTDKELLVLEDVVNFFLVKCCRSASCGGNSLNKPKTEKLLMMQNEHRQTPLHMATLHQCPLSVIALLVSVCPQAVAVKDSVEETPLDYVLRRHHVEEPEKESTRPAGRKAGEKEKDENEKIIEILKGAIEEQKRM